MRRVSVRPWSVSHTDVLSLSDVAVGGTQPLVSRVRSEGPQ
jgi:hypothetical protein